jgi:hypothetical protein
MQYVWLFALERREADCSHPYSADVMKVCCSTSIFFVPSCHTPTYNFIFSFVPAHVYRNKEGARESQSHSYSVSEVQNFET